MQSGYPVIRHTAIIADNTLSAAASEVAVSNLDLEGWTLLRLVALLRHTTAAEGGGNWERAIMRFNDDAGANYLWEVLNSDATHVANTDVGYANGIEAGHGSGPNFAAPFFGHNIYDLLLPGDSTHYTSVSMVGAAIPISTKALGTVGCGIWVNTAPVTKISIVPNEAATTWTAGSRLVLIGVA